MRNPHAYESEEARYSDWDDLPDPPENPGLLELPESFQERIAERFAHGTRLTRELNTLARKQHEACVSAMYARRAKYSAAQAERVKAQVARKRANKASLGEMVRAKAGRK